MAPFGSRVPPACPLTKTLASEQARLHKPQQRAVEVPGRSESKSVAEGLSKEVAEGQYYRRVLFESLSREEA